MQTLLPGLRIKGTLHHVWLHTYFLIMKENILKEIIYYTANPNVLEMINSIQMVSFSQNAKFIKYTNSKTQ